MKAALIATGNEIVSGQILNTNTSWLAKRLSQEGLDIHFHMGVLDDSADLLKSLNWLKNQGMDHVFVSGGLGPTRDDLTRKIVAEFCDKEFDFHQARWEELEKALLKRKITPREGHKWQCYFPKGSRHLINNLGTAWGFQTETSDGQMKIWTLPGPPQEFENVYENSIEPWLQESVHPATTLITWQCFDTPESEAAHMTEEALKGCSYEVGFRASPPITEVKLWVPTEELEENPWCLKLDQLFASILYSKNGQDYFKGVLTLFSSNESTLFIRDGLTEGLLLSEVREKYPEEIGRLDYCLSSDYQSLKSGLNISLINEGVSLEVGLGDKKVEFFEKISHQLIKKSKRARKYVLAKLIKRAYFALYND